MNAKVFVFGFSNYCECAIFIGFGFTIPLLNHMMIEASTLQNQGKKLGLFSKGVFLRTVF